MYFPSINSFGSHDHSERGTAVLPSLEEQASGHEMFTYVGRHITGAPLGLRPGLMVETRVYKALVPVL